MDKVYLVIAGERGEGYSALGAFATEAGAVELANEESFKRDLHYVGENLFTNGTAKDFIDYVAILELKVQP